MRFYTFISEIIIQKVVMSFYIYYTHNNEIIYNVCLCIFMYFVLCIKYLCIYIHNIRTTIYLYIYMRVCIYFPPFCLSHTEEFFFTCSWNHPDCCICHLLIMDPWTSQCAWHRPHKVDVGTVNRRVAYLFWLLQFGLLWVSDPNLNTY